MSSALFSLLEMMRLRARPQDLPASDALLLATVAAVALTSIVAVAQLFPLARGAARVGCDLVIQFGLLRLALQATGRGVRFRQTFAAICGTGTLFVLIAVPLYALVGGVPSGEAADGAATTAALLLLVVYVWSVIVTGHILRHAFDVGLTTGVGLSLVYVVATVLIGEWLVPTPGGP